jgi:hypothetical protein
MNSSITITGPASQLLELARNGEVLRSLVDKHADFRELLIQAADAAAKSPDLEQRLFEAVALATCTTDRSFQARWSGGSSNDAELAELDLRASRANENLGAVLLELCPKATPIGKDVSSAPSN